MDCLSLGRQYCVELMELLQSVLPTGQIFLSQWLQLWGGGLTFSKWVRGNTQYSPLDLLPPPALLSEMHPLSASAAQPGAKRLIPRMKRSTLSRWVNVY